MAALRGEQIAGQGTTEARWKASRQLNALPTTTLEQLLGSARRVVVVSRILTTKSWDAVGCLR